jgi:hypothetical protein
MVAPWAAAVHKQAVNCTAAAIAEACHHFKTDPHMLKAAPLHQQAMIIPTKLHIVSTTESIKDQSHTSA